jgi:hypothetical protein
VAVLDRAVRACYAAAGISPDPATHSRPAPLLRDLAAMLASDPDGARLADRLQPYASGSHAKLFSQPTSARPDGQLVCFSLRGLPARLQTAALLLLTLDAVWASLEGPLRKRCVLVDEAWLLMRGTRRRRLPQPLGEVGAEALVWVDDDQPGRRRPARQRSRPRDRQQRQQPDPAPPIAAGDRADRASVQPHRRGTPPPAHLRHRARPADQRRPTPPPAGDRQPARAPARHLRPGRAHRR